MNAILTMIWKILGPILIDIAITTGLPAAIEWLYKKGLPKWLVDSIVSIVSEALKNIGQIKNNPELSRSMQREGIRSVRKGAKKAVKDCVGSACPPGLK